MKLLAARGTKVNIWDHYSFWNHSPRDFQLLKGPNGVSNIGLLVACVSTLEGLGPFEQDIIISNLLKICLK